MENASPEKKLNAVNEATLNVQKKGRLDANFPDLFATFKGKDTAYDTVKKAEIVQPVISKHTIMLPSDGLESIKQYNPQTSPAGIEPSLNRAYYAIKNTLYLWDYGRREMLIHEEADDIVGIAFVKPKSDIFASNITHLLIISTVREIKIHAISINAATGVLNVYQTDMATTSADHIMTSIVGTKFGRIFMLGNDGNVWELEYRSEESWFAGKCSKKMHSEGSIFSFITTGAKPPITQIAIDETGTILYQLAENSYITIIYLGADGQSFRNVHQYKSAKEDAPKMASRAPQLAEGKVKLVSIHPVSTTESKKYRLVAITSTGCRLYFAHAPANIKNDDAPGELSLEDIRVSAPDITKDDVFSHTYYKNAVFLGVKNQHSTIAAEGDQIITYTPDLGSLANPLAIRSEAFTYREFLNGVKVPGKIITIVEAETPSTCKINELTASYEEPPRTFLALTTYGLAILVKQRPIDMLCKLLALTNQDTLVRIQDFQSFCQYFGHINVVSLCLALITCPSLVSADGLNRVEPIPDIIVKGAIDLLNEFGKFPSEDDNQYTSRHDGLALYIYRVLNPIWNKTLVKASAAIFTSNLSVDELQRTQQVLKKLTLLIQEHPNMFQLSSSNKKEEESLKNLREFVDYTTEAISFIQYIITTDLTIVVKGLKPELQARCQSITLKELLSTAEGRKLANDLAYSLIEYTFSKVESTPYVIDVLTQHCKSFCGADDVLLYKATKQAFAARSATNTTQAKTILQDSLKILKRIALHIPADKAQEIAQDFAHQGYPIYGIQITLDCAHARTLPQDKQLFYDIVFDLLYQVMTKPAGSSTANERVFRNEIFNAAFASCDMAYAFYMYEKFLQKNLGQQLIEFNSPYLENFLTTSQPLTAEKIVLLAQYYKLNERYEEAAIAFYNLAISMDDLNRKITYLTEAAICSRSVTAPSKQYDIYLLNEAIKENLELAHQQQAIPTQ